MDAATLDRLAALPGVEDAVEQARAACTALRWHQALRRQTGRAAAESTARAARASAAMDGAELPVDVVRDVLRGAAAAPADPVGRAVQGAVRATVETAALHGLLRRAPGQVLARLHTAAAAGLAPDDALGRPRRDGEAPRDLGGAQVPAPAAAVVSQRLEALGQLLTADGPALVVAALAHAELLALRPFVVGNGVVARALERLVLVERGLDPTGVAVPEAGHLELGLPAYAGALQGYVRGTPDGVAGWLRHCAAAAVRGAAEGTRVADAVLTGRLGPPDQRSR